MSQRLKSKEPTFTVIVPCMNAQATLRETLDSVRAQEFEHWEAIIVDNGSGDATPGIIEEYCSLDYRFRSMMCDRKGPSAARNSAGLLPARGTYLAFLDSDDLWTADKLAESFKVLERDTSIDAVYGQISFFRQDPKMPETHSTIYPKRLNAVELLRDNPVCTMSNLVINASLFRQLHGFDETIVHNEDVEFLVRVIASGARIEGIDKHLVSYRTSISGLSANLALMREGWHKAIATLQATPHRLSPTALAQADAGNLRYLARRALRTDAPGLEALALAMKGITRSPKSFFDPPRRGGLTLLGALAAPVLPKPIRNKIFCR